jgi:hypothetical protein
MSELMDQLFAIPVKRVAPKALRCSNDERCQSLHECVRLCLIRGAGEIVVVKDAQLAFYESDRSPRVSYEEVNPSAVLTYTKLKTTLCLLSEVKAQPRSSGSTTFASKSASDGSPLTQDSVGLHLRKRYTAYIGEFLKAGDRLWASILGFRCTPPQALC